MQPRVFLRGLFAMITGYGAIVLLTSLGFNGLLGGQPIYGNSRGMLLAGMMVAVISGLVGGYVAAMIGSARGWISAALVLIPLAVDSTFVLFFYKGNTAPFWFDALASATLMACTLAGGFLHQAVARRAAISSL